MSLPENELRVRFRLVQAQARTVAPPLYSTYPTHAETSAVSPIPNVSRRSKPYFPFARRSGPHLYLDTLHVPA
jgi:hypothetical protein